MASGVDVKFPSGRVCLGYQCFWCVGWDHLCLGARVKVLAWGGWVCVYSGRYLGVYSVLVMSLVRYGEVSVFLGVFALFLFRVVLSPRRCMIEYEGPGPHY